ncbi:baseplate J/gp47 family protein [Flavobacterium sp. SUN052]|uniref:baseplate J/gp47 family protein n=1 Tax=Flavobacterium sp. SUN052 TaxID=3002441 RepID=UPI00237E7B4C|nr:baseplate J/gp47 family protein [Flavobacterium sp. SUN052]MEC4004866.1 baseplate J/gp47 family protein [Flavobacterium sp. SUN052]
MENCSTNIEIHQSSGTTQDERFLSALHSHYFLIDERNEVDYIEFAQKISEFIKFFNDSNSENGNWSTFFQWESTSILVNLFLWDVNKIQEDYKAVKGKIKIIEDLDDSSVQEVCKIELKTFFEKIKVQFEKFNIKINQLDDTVVTKSYFVDSAYLIINPNSAPHGQERGFLQIILDDIEDSTLDLNPIKSLISKYQFDKNVQRLIGLLFNWKQVSGESVENQLNNYSSHSPHYSLYLAFLKQLGVAKDHLNQFTKRHLDFYYKDILKIKPNSATPDYVNLILETVTQTSGLFLPQGSVFSAGKNSLGKNKFYASTSELAINGIKLGYFKSTFFQKNVRSQSNFIGQNATNTSFNVFKDAAIGSETGILIASPLFFLNGGDRYLMLTINGVDIEAKNYRFFITAEHKCIEIFAESLTNDATNADTEKQVVRSFLVIKANEKKIIAHDIKVHTEINVITSYPVLKIVPKDDSVIIGKDDKIGIEVKVRNSKNFVLATDTGTVDINKPFVPFGEFPKNGSGFTICCNEFAFKKNARLFVKINNLATNDNFSSLGLKIMKLDKGLWRSVHDGESISSGILNTSPIYDFYLEDSIPTIESVSGYYRIELDGGVDYEDEAFLNNFITQSRTQGGILKAIPRIDSIVIDYDVKDDSYNNVIDVFQIMPFGYQQLNKKDEITGIWEINSLENFVEANRGEIYLGFDNVEIGNSLNLLIQLSEGSSNPLREPALLEWSYLKYKNTWESIKVSEIGDETDSLMQSGLIHYTIPEFDTSQTTILPSDKFWIKINVDVTDAICQFLGVHTQAFKAVLTDFEKNGSYFIEHTEKETITKLYEPISFVKKVFQPYASFGGSNYENDDLLYQRTSERLRHKNRAITSWDYERLILQKFPNIYRIKSLNHYRYDTLPPSKISAGYVTLIPIGKSNSLQENITWKPLVSQDTINKIKQYISEIGSPHARVMVKQPKLETIVLKFNVKYKDLSGADLRLYGNKLKDLINKYLSPWSFGENEVQFANSLEIASIIQLIDDQSYVDFITDFEVLHYFINEDGSLGSIANIKKIIPHTDYTLFVPPTLFTYPVSKNNNISEIRNLIQLRNLNETSSLQIDQLSDISNMEKKIYLTENIIYDHIITPLLKDNNC